MNHAESILQLLSASNERANAATLGPWHVASNPEGMSQPAFPYVCDDSGLPTR
jgi:hypothetical protein